MAHPLIIKLNVRVDKTMEKISQSMHVQDAETRTIVREHGQAEEEEVSTLSF